jgi:hypothetical protein
MQKQQTKKIIMDVITGVIVAGVFVVGYFAFKKNDVAPADILTLPTDIADQVVAVGSKVDGTIRDLKDLNRSVEKFSAVFKTPAFTSLQDFSATIAPETIGRPNPFLPTDWKLMQKTN